MWPGQQEEPPRARQYLEFTACLLTGERGTAEPAAAPVWAGLQEASLSTRAKVQYLAVTGPQTVENAVPFLNSLAQTGCNLIFAAGDVPVAAVEQAAATFPSARFFPVGSAVGVPVDPGAARGNVTPVVGTTPAEVSAAVAATLTQAVAAAK